MTITSLHSAASGLSALNTALDVTANNLANVNTAGSSPAARTSRTCCTWRRRSRGCRTRRGRIADGPLRRAGCARRRHATGLCAGAARALGPAVRHDDQRMGFFRVQVPESVGTGGFAYTRDGSVHGELGPGGGARGGRGPRPAAGGQHHDPAGRDVSADHGGRARVRVDPGERRAAGHRADPDGEFVNPVG